MKATIFTGKTEEELRGKQMQLEMTCSANKCTRLEVCQDQ